MVNAPQFDSYNQMISSNWQAIIEEEFIKDQWPPECLRCQTSENIGATSIRQYSLRQNIDGLTVGGVLDNICNSACQSCNPGLSTRIGRLYGRNYPRFSNLDQFYSLPQEQITTLDINGGEPSTSPNYRYLLQNLPPFVKRIRINTNGSRVLENIQKLLDSGIHITITLSLDGISNVHDYVRWPIIWNDYQKTMDTYLEYQTKYKNLDINCWTVVHCLNINDLDNIIQFVEQKKVAWAYALIEEPIELRVQSKNSFTIKALDRQLPNEIKRILASELDNQSQLDNFIRRQDQLRNIKIDSYIER